MKCRYSIFIALFFCVFPLFLKAQFNDKINAEIQELSKKYKLQNVDPNESFGVLESISIKPDQTSLAKNLIGRSWKYSHSVSTEGRQFRISNAILIFNFQENNDAYIIFKNNDQVKIPCVWSFDWCLLVDEYASEQRSNSLKRRHFGIHLLTEDRLVLSRLISSKKYKGKMEVLYEVYFRR